jgi:hypothetical protein
LTTPEGGKRMVENLRAANIDVEEVGAVSSISVPAIDNHCIEFEHVRLSWHGRQRERRRIGAEASEEPRKGRGGVIGRSRRPLRAGAGFEIGEVQIVCVFQGRISRYDERIDAATENPGVVIATCGHYEFDDTLAAARNARPQR